MLNLLRVVSFCLAFIQFLMCYNKFIPMWTFPGLSYYCIFVYLPFIVCVKLRISPTQKHKKKKTEIFGFVCDVNKIMENRLSLRCYINSENRKFRYFVYRWCFPFLYTHTHTYILTHAPTHLQLYN